MSVDNLFLSHIDKFWDGYDKEAFEWAYGPVETSIPGFRVIRVSPIRDGIPWIYLSMGASRIGARSNGRLEFFIIAPQEDPIHVESLAMVSHFHADPTHELDIGSVVRIGRPWIDGSTCDSFLVSLPYPFGPKLEHCEASVGQIRVLWLLPITAVEAEFAISKGTDKLEELFDEASIDYDDPQRPSVV